MINVSKCGTMIGIQDDFLNMYLDNGWVVVKDAESDEPLPKPKPKSTKSATKKKSSTKPKTEE